MRNITVGFLGCGNIGCGVWKLLKEFETELMHRSGVRFTIKKILVRDVNKKRDQVVPDRIIGRNTVANLQSGVVNGHVGQVIYLVNEMRKEMDCPDAKVIATGGMARLVAARSGVIDHIDGLLTLKGLRLIYEKNMANA